MDIDDRPRRSDDLLAQLARQDLDPFSVDELKDRIAELEGEVLRAREKIKAAVNHLSSAESLFKR